VGGHQQSGQPLDGWLRANAPRHPDDLNVIAEVHEMIMNGHLGFAGIRVLGEARGRLIYEVGSLTRARLTIVGRDPNIWEVAVEAPNSPKLETTMLFHPMTTLPESSDLPSERKFPCYSDSHKQFAFWTASSAKLIIVAWQIGRQIK
jgi:hypothetical protein